MRTYYFEQWIAQDALRTYPNARAASVLLDGVEVCGIVRDEGVGSVYVSITHPYRPENTRVMFSRGMP